MVKKTSILFLFFVLLASCAPNTPQPAPVFTPIPATATATLTPMPAALWIHPAAPRGLRAALDGWDIPRAARSQAASARLEPARPGENGLQWIYALVAPFPTLVDGASSADVLRAWQGLPAGPYDAFGNAPLAGRPLLMSDSTLAAFTAVLGEPAPGAARSVPEDQLSDALWAEMPAWGIVPFEELNPRLKVLTVDGQSPVHKNFDAAAYPLTVTFALRGEAPPELSLPFSNRDAGRLTTVILTGTTAMVDAMGVVMERKGPTYPGKYIRPWLVEADILHISNEVPFDKDCPFPNPGNKNLAILCSRPQYLELLLDIGADVVELTGEHFNNRGTEAMLSTLQVYRDNNLPYYGGGANAADAKKPVTLERGGNRFMFIGCNLKQNYRSALATERSPGAAPCDFPYMTAQIAEYRAQGYIPIVTFQDYEYYSPEARPGQTINFRMMIDAGAALASGSQGHFSQVMEFYNGAFIHYALGNLFYTQMSYTLPDGSVTDRTRWEFLDRHVFYDGRHISTELLTAMLEDFSTPRPMTPPERYTFLNLYFSYSGWMSVLPTPVPSPTMTLTPIAYPVHPTATPTLAPAP